MLFRCSCVVSSDAPGDTGHIKTSPILRGCGVLLMLCVRACVRTRARASVRACVRENVIDMLNVRGCVYV